MHQNFVADCPTVNVLGTKITLAQTDFVGKKGIIQPMAGIAQTDCLPGRVLVSTSPLFPLRFRCDTTTGYWGKVDPVTTPICFVGTGTFETFNS